MYDFRRNKKRPSNSNFPLVGVLRLLDILSADKLLVFSSRYGKLLQRPKEKASKTIEPSSQEKI